MVYGGGIMAQYLTYDEYLNYGGTMTADEFTVEEFKARSRIDWLTLARVKEMKVVPEEVKLAMMVIIKYDSKYSVDAQISGGGIISSYSTDGYSESYGGITEQTMNAETQVNKQVCKMLFGVLDDYGVPLIYKGLD